MNKHALVFVVGLAGCADNNPSKPPVTPAVNPTTPAGSGTAAPDLVVAQGDPKITFGCGAGVPWGACRELERIAGARFAGDGATLKMVACAAPDDKSRVGEWRYAVVAEHYTHQQQVALKDLAAKQPRFLDQEVATLLGTGVPEKFRDGEMLAPTGDRWAILPANAVLPNWQVIPVDGVHPLADKPGGLVVPLCIPGVAEPIRVANIDPAKMTTLTMTGVTALTRRTGLMMDDKGSAYVADDVKAWFAGSDLVHVSNEVSFTPECKYEGNTMSFCTKDDAMKALDAIGVNIVELTGSHLGDKGRKWLARSVDMYEKKGWKWFGGGRTQIEATRPLVIERDGNKIAFLGCNAARTEDKKIKDGPDTAYCDFKRMAWQIQDLRHRGHVVVVAIQHWEHDQTHPDGKLVRDFRRMAEAGADVVFGSQAHVPNGWEVHHGTFIHYGPGNFFFHQSITRTMPGAIDRFYIHDGNLLAVEQLYTWVAEWGKPRPQTDGERKRFLAEMAAGMKKIKPPKPWAARLHDRLKPPPRQHPDSVLIGNEPQHLLVSEPKGAAGDGKTKWPLVIYLHGTDERGKPLDALLEFGLPHRLAEAPDLIPAFVASPIIPSRNITWTPDRVIAVLDFMLAKYPIDPQRVYLTGFSNGAFGVWKTAIAHPDKFAALVPVAGYGDDRQACIVKDIPVWAFHGDKDWNVKIDGSRQMQDAIVKCGGGKSKLTVYEGAVHQDAWKKAYATADLWTWLLQQKR